GTGSRLHPLTRITNKHLLPIYDRPMVTYAIEALVSGGLTEIMVVTGGTHAGEFFRLLGDGHEHGIGLLQYAYQEREGGIAEALGLTERFAGSERVLVMLADNVFGQSIKPAIENFARQERGARIVLSKVEEPEHLRHLGVAQLDGDKVVRIVEKPEQPPSEYAVTGLYFYDSSVFEFLPSLSPSARGELEITDVNNWFVEQGLMEYDVVDGFWGDAGESIDAYYEVNDYVRENGANGGSRGCAGSSCGASRTSAAVLSRSTARVGTTSRCGRRTSRSPGRAGSRGGTSTSAGRTTSSCACRGRRGWSSSTWRAARPSPRTSGTRILWRST